MKAAARYKILWVAHVLPLYAIRFRLSAEEALKLLASLELEEWVEGDKKDVGIRDLVRHISPSFLQAVYPLGGISVPCLNVPEMAGIARLYSARFGIDLPLAYSFAMELAGEDFDTSFISWYISLTHVVGTSLQLLCCARVSWCVCVCVCA